ncbi:SLAM family member 6 isoform X1 [Balaenoptera musculus]|uniref:SLAM family member 6 isoform X1 n=1 Tax=Balaenoptera musculus TaxID=9771 RepID=A0A8B8YRP8_BALMU|nr:SLAM family member 6 isoform X1 [Balaenoptera musculus]
MIWLFQFLTLVFCLGPGNTVSQTSSTPLIVNGVVGESVTLTLKSPVEEKIMSITWLHDGKSIIFIEPNEALNRVTDPKRKNRLKVTKSYSLQLSNLTMADTGTYSAQITTLTSSLFTSYDLRIFRRLRNLQVVPHTKWSKNRTCEIHLTCSVENPNDNILFRWQVSGNTLQSEANLTISWDPKSFDEETYTCVAENPVSNSSFSVSVQSLCKSFFQFSTPQTQCPAETVRNLEYASFSPGNTVYAQVTHSNREMEIPKPVKNNDSTTIYSEVQ